MKTLEGDIYACACCLVKQDGGKYTHTITLSQGRFTSENEAIGSATKYALQAKPGYSIAEILCTRETDISSLAKIALKNLLDRNLISIDGDWCPDELREHLRN